MVIYFSTLSSFFVFAHRVGYMFRTIAWLQTAITIPVSALHIKVNFQLEVLSNRYSLAWSYMQLLILSASVQYWMQFYANCPFYAGGNLENMSYLKHNAQMDAKSYASHKRQLIFPY